MNPLFLSLAPLAGFASALPAMAAAGATQPVAARVHQAATPATARTDAAQRPAHPRGEDDGYLFV